MVARQGAHSVSQTNTDFLYFQTHISKGCQIFPKSYGLCILIFSKIRTQGENFIDSNSNDRQQIH